MKAEDRRMFERACATARHTYAYLSELEQQIRAEKAAGHEMSADQLREQYAVQVESLRNLSIEFEGFKLLYPNDSTVAAELREIDTFIARHSIPPA